MKMSYLGLLLLLGVGAPAVARPHITPKVIGGKYYFFGTNCATYQVLDADSIRCFNSDGQFSYVATGLTAEQAQPEIAHLRPPGYGKPPKVQLSETEQAERRAQRQQDINNLMQTMQQTAQSFQQSAQAFQQQAQSYTPPAATNPSQGGTTIVHCITAGIYTQCRGN